MLLIYLFMHACMFGYSDASPLTFLTCIKDLGELYQISYNLPFDKIWLI